MRSPSTLRAEIAAWDGKRAGEIRAIYERHGSHENFAEALVDCFEHEDAQRGSTWLLKRHLEQSPDPAAAATVRNVYSRLESLVHWEAKLHVLQSMPYMPIPAALVQAVETFVRACLQDEAKFVRAWAYNGFYELARQYPSYRAEATGLFDRALDEEPASVKARVRNIVKKGFS